MSDHPSGRAARDRTPADPRSQRPGDRRGAEAVSRPAGSLSSRDPDAPRPQRRRVRAGCLLGPQPARPRGPGGGPQAPGHVHRVHRLARSHALPLGDHRQRGRRGAGRALHADRRRAAPRRLGRGARRRARHPGRRGAAHRADRRRGRHDQAARRRQVRRRVLRRDRRPARRRRLGGQRPGRAARRRGRPRRQDPRDELPPRDARHVRQRHAGLARSSRSPACASSARSPRSAPAPASATGPTGRSFLKDAAISLDELHNRARQTAFLVPGLTIVVRDARGVGADASRPSATTAASASSASSSPPTRRVSDVLRLQGVGHFTETVPVLDEQGHMTPQEVRARAHRRRRPAVGHRLRHDGPLVRQHHRHAQGRHPRRRASSGRWPGRSTRRCAPSGSCARPRTTSSRTTCSRA